MTTTTQFGPIATLTVNNSSAQIDIVDNNLQISLDEGNSPYFTASVVIARPTSLIFDALDPTKRANVNISIQYSPSATLAFTSLYVYERTYDPAADTVALTLVSLEMLMNTYSPPNQMSWVAYQNSVKTVADKVLSQAIGFTATSQLVGGAIDQNARVFSAAQNLASNPKLGVNTTQWLASGNAGTSSVFARATNTSAVYPFTSFARLQYGTSPAAAAAGPGIQYVQQGSYTAGQEYTIMFYGQVSKSGGNMMSARLVWRDSSNGEVGIRSYAATRSTTTNWAQRFIINATAPANAATAEITFYGGTGATNWVSGDTIYATGMMIVEGPGYDPTSTTSNAYYDYFDGVKADTADYHYGWADVADASSSVRVPLVQRPPETLYWNPDTSAGDFLKPLLDAAGLRLFLREDGVWCLADNGYSVPGQVTMQYRSNLYDGGETVSIGDTDSDGYPQNADGVALTYEWEDAITGEKKTAMDKAVPAGARRVYRTTLNKPYPGPGQAAYLLARLVARKASLTVLGRSDFTARPGMTGFVSLPNRPDYTSYVAAVGWDLSSATMQLTTKAVLTAVAASYARAPQTQTYASVPNTVTYASYTN